MRIPSGPLREKLNNLKKYDAIFINGKVLNRKFINQIKKINPKIAIFNGEYICSNLYKYKKNSYLIFSGIGNPLAFKNTLSKYNIKFKSSLVYPDHYDYSNNDIRKIKKIAKDKNLKILTTEKDFYRIPIKERGNIDYLKVNLKINKQKGFKRFIMKNL